MSSSYPGALDTTVKFPQTVEDDTDSTSGTDLGQSTTVGFLAQWMRDAGDAHIKVQTALGINPQGTFTDVAARLGARITCRKTADQAFATTTLANVTDMSFPVAASLDYTFHFVCMFTLSTTTTGIAFAFTGPASPTAFSAGASFYALTGAGVATNVQGGASAYSAKMSNSSGTAAATNYICDIHGILSNGANAGTLQLQASEGGGTAASVTVKKGSYGELYIN